MWNACGFVMLSHYATYACPSQDMRANGVMFFEVCVIRIVN
jgi:hypothetical protein